MKQIIYIFIFLLSIISCTQRNVDRDEVVETDVDSLEDLIHGTDTLFIKSTENKTWTRWQETKLEGNPYITNFQLDESIDKQNWAISQDNENIMLYTNRRGILTFDGDEWNFIKTPGFPNAIAKGEESGKVFVGCNDNFGYLMRNEKGVYLYYSISSNYSNLREITHIEFSKNYIYFYSENVVTRVSKKDYTDLKQWEAIINEPYSGIIKYKEKIFVIAHNIGLFEIDSDVESVSDTSIYLSNKGEIPYENRNTLLANDSLSIENKLVLDENIIGTKIHSTFFIESQIMFNVPFNEKYVLIGTSENKLYLFDGENFYEYIIEASEFLSESIMSGGLSLSYKELAFSTLTGGCIIVAKGSGKTIANINYQTGLPDDEIYTIGKDNSEGLWISHGMGISRVNYSLPLRNFHTYPGINGNLISIIDFNGTIYVATSDGVYYLSEVKDYKEIEVLVKIKQEPIDELIVTVDADGSLMEQEKKLSYRFEQKQTQKQKGWRERLMDIVYSKKSTDDKTENESWENKNLLKKEEETSKQTPTKQRIVKKQQLRTRYKSQKTYALKSIRKMFKKIDGLNEKCKQMVVYRDMLLVATNTGLYEIRRNRVKPIVEGKYINYITPSKYSNRLYIGADQGIFSIFFNKNNSTWKVENNFNDIKENVHSILETDSIHIWLGCENIAYRIRLNSLAIPDTISYYYFTSDFSERIVVRNINNMPFFFLSSGFFYYDAEKDNIIEDKKLLPETILNSKQIYLQDSLTWIYNKGEWHLENNIPEIQFLKEVYFNLFDDIQNVYVDSLKNMWIIDGKSIYKILSPNQQKITLHDFDVYIKNVFNNQGIFFKLKDLVLNNNSIQFTTAAPFFVKSQSTQYQYILHGLVSNWSNWSHNSHIGFSYIPSGRYILQIRAKNILGKISKSKFLTFEIEPSFWETWWFYTIIALVLTGLVFLLIKSRVRKLQNDKRKLEEKVRERTEKIRKQQQEIKDSIIYASRIQTSVMPPVELINNILPHHFILNKPRYIVSGDYYWITKKNNKTIIAAADCTGHGVPGAMMSMLGITSLNEIVNKREISQANEILNELRKQVKTSLRQTGKRYESPDGMDIALCVIDNETRKLQFAGAYNPLYFIRNNKLNILKPDIMPIGYYRKEKQFSNQEISILPGDIFYIFSDGYVDQFGGENYTKFNLVKFRQQFLEIHKKTMAQQKEILEKTIEEWRGDNDQIDDILIVGFKI